MSDLTFSTPDEYHARFAIYLNNYLYKINTNHFKLIVRNTQFDEYEIELIKDTV